MITRKSKFEVGDLVAHQGSKQKGIVRDVRNGWVKFEVLEKRKADGSPYYARFASAKVTLLATRSQVAAYVIKKQAVKAKQRNITSRVASWVKRLWKGKPPAQVTPQIGGEKTAPAV